MTRVNYVRLFLSPYCGVLAAVICFRHADQLAYLKLTRAFQKPARVLHICRLPQLTNGQWNLGQYLVARGSDLPLHDLEIEMLPPLTPDEPPKGMAEVVMVPVVPAILNAIFDATGVRLRALPLVPQGLKV